MNRQTLDAQGHWIVTWEINTAFHGLAQIILIYFITSSEFNAYQMWLKLFFSTVKKYRIFSLMTDTIYIFIVE